jgi:vacuolar-type H+-ATPase subunit I/STV1
MSEVEKALDRLGNAVAALVDHLTESTADTGPDPKVAELAAERDRMKAELEALRVSREDDAKLRAEAASAVREALRDLRGLAAAGANG